MGPLPGPIIFFSVEGRGTEPILQREFVTVANAEAALFGAVHEKQTAE
jgi:hypothetical protein